MPARSHLLGDVEIGLEAHVGRAAMTVSRFNALKPGEAIPLDAALNQSIELRLNGITVARGELVAIDERFGVRLTEVAA